MTDTILGVDIGGTGMKAAPVDVANGKLLAPKFRLPTPKPATPAAMAQTLRDLQTHFGWQGAIGCGFPAVVRGGRVGTANNIHKSWIGVNALELFGKATGCQTTIINDADAAGLAEAAFGAARGRRGLVLLLTIGTGIGTGMLFDGKLVPNAELGSVWYKGDLAEEHVSNKARIRDALGWKAWAERFNEYLHFIETFLQPELIVLGGGASKKHAHYGHLLNPRAEVLPASFGNKAGIIGAAVAAARQPAP